jgi:hypothetical protein
MGEIIKIRNWYKSKPGATVMFLEYSNIHKQSGKIFKTIGKKEKKK